MNVQQLNIPPNIETIKLISMDAAIGSGTAEPTAGVGARLRLILDRNFWYLILVVLPTITASLYFTALAANRYQSEARFTVRSPSMAAASQIAGMVQGSSIIRSADDAFIVHAYIRSRDAVRKLQQSNNLRAMLAAPRFDFLWGYPGPVFSHSEERLWRHFNDFIDLDYDNSTGISTLKVQAFQPEDAKKLSEALLTDAEALINRLSERAQGDAVRLADDEVERGRGRARAALQTVTDFRRRNSLIDPNRASASALELMTRLSLEVAQTNAQLTELKKSSPDSPQAAALKNRIDALEAQIERERRALAGADTSLAPLIAEYDRLSLEREFAERAFVSAQSALDVARLDANRQRLFLERISTPAAPDYPQFPMRLLSCLAVFVLVSMLYSIGRRLVADTIAHAGQ